MDISALSKGSREVLRNLASVAEQLERGQAATPLVEQVQALGEGAEHKGVTLFLLGLTPEARAAALGWLVGPQYQSVTVRLAEPADLIEIRLQERGFTLESQSDGRRDFETLDALIDAYGRVASDATGAVLEPVRVGLASPPPMHDLTILVPGGPPDAFAASASLLSRVSGRGAILAVAASVDHAWSDLDRQAVAMLLPNTLAGWPIFCGGAQAALPSEGWLLLRSPESVPLPATRLDLAAVPFPEFLREGPQQPLRVVLREMAIQRGATGALDMIAERYQADLRQLQARQKRESRLERSAESGEKEQELRTRVDRLKTDIADDFAKLQQSIREASRRTMLKSGDLSLALDKQLASLHAADLEREAQSRAIRLTLKPEVLGNIRHRLGKALKQQLDEECTLIRDTIDLTRQNAERVLAELGATNRSLSMVPPDNRALWEPLDEMLHLDIKYRGELPRRGFMQRLGEGRRVVFVVLMVLSLVGSFIGFNIRQAAIAGVLFLALFVGTVIYTFSAWKKEETELLDREIDKVRESVGVELSRVLNDVLREKQGRLQQLLDEYKRDALAKIDVAAREAQASRAQSTDLDRREAKTKLRLVEQRIRELQPLGQQIERLRSSVSQLGRDAQSLLRQAASGSNGSASRP